MIGQEIGNYRIVKELGAGGMGQVFVAEHGILGHRVAIKILHGKYLEDEEMRARFLNEARAVARLKHPSIVDLFDFGYLDDGTGYIIMELLSGQSLRERLGADPLTLAQATELARQVAAALSVAHRSGVIHRDLKPDNIFLVDDGEVPGGQRAVVLDFGLAKQVAVETSDVELTNSGFVVGTPAYMSPEQCRGVRELDGRSDIYALGVMLYRMCTGQRPFDADSPGELLGQHLYVEPVAPRTLRPDVSPAIEAIILRCLAKRPEDRFADAHQLAEALHGVGQAADSLARASKPALVSGTSPTAIGPEPAAPTRETAIGREPAAPTRETAIVRKGTAGSRAPAVQKSRWPWLLGGGVLTCGALALWFVSSFASGSSSDTHAPLADGGIEADAAPSDALALDDAQADASIGDAGLPDAIDAPRSGRELFVWVQAARRRGDAKAGLAACQAGAPDDSATYSACAVVACIAGDIGAARGYWRSIRATSIRESTARACAQVGVSVRQPW